MFYSFNPFPQDLAGRMEVMNSYIVVENGVYVLWIIDEFSFPTRRFQRT